MLYAALWWLQVGCKKWAENHECKRTPDYMLSSCKASCDACWIHVLSRSFRVIKLNSGHDMPTVGFGTAGLGMLTKQAVVDALHAGYDMIDSAQVPAGICFITSPAWQFGMVVWLRQHHCSTAVQGVHNHIYSCHPPAIPSCIRRLKICYQQQHSSL